MKIKLSMTTIALAAAMFTATHAAATSPAQAPTPVCANDEVKSKVAAFYKKLPSAPPLVAKRHTGLPEALVASAIDTAHATGVSGEHFHEIWNSMTEWPFGFFIFDKNGWIWKFQVPIPAALGNKRHDEFFDVRSPGPQGLVSHLRPDLVHSIYAVELPGGLGADGKDRQDATRAIIFYDDTQQSIFGVYASVAGDDIPRDAIPGFEATLALMRSLPSLCQTH